MVGKFSSGIGLGIGSIRVLTLPTKSGTATLGVIHTLGFSFAGSVTIHIFGPAIKSTGFARSSDIGGVISTIYIDGGAQSQGTMVTGAQRYGIATG